MSAHSGTAAQLSTAAVHEAAGRTGALPSSIKPLSPRMYVWGRAFPVRLPAGDNLWLHRAVYAASPGEVLIADAGDGFEYGYWGEILTQAAIARRLAGLVINAGVRDSRQLAEAGWPVFAERVCIRGTGKNPAGDGKLGEPVRVGDVTVRLGDLIIGDADGVVCIPAREADRVQEGARTRDEAERGYLERIRAGETTLGIYRLEESLRTEREG